MYKGTLRISGSGAGPFGFPAHQQPVAFSNKPHPNIFLPTKMIPPPPEMIPPPRPINCPPGLEYLSVLDNLLIFQQIEFLEALTGFETNNRYEIKNLFGQRIYYAVEENDFCTRNCCGSLRPFVIKILDYSSHEVIHIERPLKCASCYFPCCLQKLEIQSPPGSPIGYIVQKWHPFLPKFTVLNERHEKVLTIVGPYIVSSCFSNIDFNIKSLNEKVIVGKITKQWSGFFKETFTDADNFSIQFPLDLDVKMKAVMLGACFLIDLLFFEVGGTKAGVWC